MKFTHKQKTLVKFSQQPTQRRKHSTDSSCKPFYVISVFFSRKGLPISGHDNEQRNFLQLLNVHGHSDPSILKWLKKKHDKFTSAEIQKEIGQVMALRILGEDGYFFLMVEETTKQSNREQVVILLRHVDSELNVHESYGAFY